jgi:hypothetical protein
VHFLELRAEQYDDSSSFVVYMVYWEHHVYRRRDGSLPRVNLNNSIVILDYDIRASRLSVWPVSGTVKKWKYPEKSKIIGTERLHIYERIRFKM